MPQYLIAFNQQWVGEHDADWFQARGVLARAVVEQMRTQGVLVFAGGLDEDIDRATGIDVVGGEARVVDGPLRPHREYLGGLTIVDVSDDEAARMWGSRIAEACGWPQEVRRFKG